jgi:glycine/D-amino acid oxidase-like deaminating enzyme
VSPQHDTEYFDVIIIGAGIAGLGAAYRITERNPGSRGPARKGWRPWNVRQNYFADAIDYRFDRIEEAMVFGRADEKAALAG